MAATLQELSGGRLLLGIGAGGGRDTPYVGGAGGARACGPGRRSPTGGGRRAGPHGAQGRVARPPWERRWFPAARAFPSNRRGRLWRQDGRPRRCARRRCQPAWWASAARAARGGAVLPRRGGRRPCPLPRDRLAPPNSAVLDHLEELGVHRAVVFVGPPFERAVSRVHDVLAAR